ncbi:MAG: hypothetical protein IK093_12185 [Ruminiclostridium sp.]|nr:hypothetical protein [Ruminiclostridium sp.]
MPITTSSITGTITGNDFSIDVTDEIIMQNGLSITMTTSDYSDLKIGTFNAAKMKLNIYDDDAAQHDFTDALIVLTLHETDEDENTTDTDLGLYIVDSTLSSRKRNQVKLVAFDKAVNFDIVLSSSFKNTEFTPLTLLQTACADIDVPLADSTNLSIFPNHDVTFKLTSNRVQSYRDAIIETVRLMCANAVINRDGELEIRRARYDSGEDWLITGAERFTTEFSDTRTYINWIRVLSEKKDYRASSSIVITDPQARPAPYNVQCTLMDTETTGLAWLEYIDSFMQRRVKTKILSNVSIKLGDCIRFAGGEIDIRRSILAVVTGIVWQYKGYMEIQCAAPNSH